MSHQIFIKLPASKTRKKVICKCNICKGKKEPCDPRTRDAHIEKYGTCEDLVGSSELQADIPSSTNPQIESSSTSLANISSHSLLVLDFQEKSFLVKKKIKRKQKL